MALPINTALQSLNLASNDLDNKDMKKTVMGLRENATLECVDLQNILFMDAGAEVFRKQGAKLWVKKLYMFGNRFGMDDVQVMIESVPSEKLDF